MADTEYWAISFSTISLVTTSLLLKLNSVYTQLKKKMLQEQSLLSLGKKCQVACFPPLLL